MVVMCSVQANADGIPDRISETGYNHMSVADITYLFEVLKIQNDVFLHLDAGVGKCRIEFVDERS